MDREVKHLKQTHIPIVKVRWNSKKGPEFTWERQDQMQKKYPHLFLNSAPMEDTTAPEVFMDLINWACKPYLDKLVIVFIDDIFIYSSINKEYEEHLRLTLGFHKNKGLYAKFSKCEFWLLKVKFLGHIVDSQGIHIQYHPGKASVAADALSRNERVKPLSVRALVMTINSNLPLKIHKAQIESLKKENVKDKNLHGMDKEFENRLGGTLYIRKRSWLSRFHQWPDIEADITTYVIKCLTCLKMRDDYQKPFGLLVQPEKPHWKWENIAMDFITRLPKTTSSHDTIWVIVIIKKNYANERRKPLEFQIGNKTMLKVSPWKGVIRFGKRGKLNPRYIRPFKIIAKIGTVSYRLELPEQLSRVHKQVEIMDREVKRLKQSRILIVKVRWNSKRGPEFTWEREYQVHKKYPHLFTNSAPASEVAS
nr:putative reverse transcriptase domain-containing protein [Tanacetum cinerariifolium]